MSGGGEENIENIYPWIKEHKPNIVKPTAAAAKKEAEKKPDDGVRKVNNQLSSVFSLI